MNPKEELTKINKEIAKEVKEFNDWNRIIKHKKQRMARLFEQQARIWKKLIGQAKHDRPND